MNFVLARVICVIAGYIFGLFETGAIIARRANVDLRKEGSGNIGTTNSLRVLGPKAGLITLLGDVGKCVLVMFLVFLVFRNIFPAPENGYRLLMVYAGMGTILGHNFPFYHGFKGGKGVACVGGMVLAFSPALAGIAFAVFVIVVIATRYVSLGSMSAELFLIIETIFFGYLGMFTKLQGAYLIELEILFFLNFVLCVFQHRANVGRLLRGEENKFSFKKSGKKAETEEK